MRALLAIPAHLTPRVADALLALHSVKAESVQHAVVNEAEAGQPEPVRAYLTDLLELDELLDQLDFDANTRRAVTLTGKREVLAAAVYNALAAAADELTIGCGDYLNGRVKIDRLFAASKDVRGLLALLRRVEIDATARLTTRRL